MAESNEASLNAMEVRSYFVRGRNALAARADFGPLYEDYYLHWMQHAIRFPAVADDMLKDALAAMVLHLASRPRDETVAWTVNFPFPPLSLFVTGSSNPGNVTGRVWTTGIRAAEHGLFCADFRDGRGGERRSAVEFDAGDFFAAAGAFYAKSEQRPARIFRPGPEDFVMLSAQPDCDLGWFHALDEEAVRRMDQDEELALLETRHYQFDCGCTAEAIVRRLAVLSGEDRAALFHGTNQIRVDCPRCGAVFEISKSLFDKLAG